MKFIYSALFKGIAVWRSVLIINEMTQICKILNKLQKMRLVIVSQSLKSISVFASNNYEWALDRLDHSFLILQILETDSN